MKFLFDDAEVTDVPVRSYLRMASETTIPPDETLPSTEMPETSVCSYCGVEYILTEGHRCVPGVPAGTVVQTGDGSWAIILEAGTETVIYLDIKLSDAEVIEAREFQQRFL